MSNEKRPAADREPVLPRKSAEDEGEQQGEMSSPPMPTDTKQVRRSQESTITSPAQSSGKRVALLLGILLLLCFAYYLRPTSGPRKIIYANRYSKEHKFRPAASPIITETLADGRLKVRGAAPTTSSTPTPTLRAFEQKKARALRRAQKKRKARKSRGPGTRH